MAWHHLSAELHPKLKAALVPLVRSRVRVTLSPAEIDHFVAWSEANKSFVHAPACNLPSSWSLALDAANRALRHNDSGVLLFAGNLAVADHANNQFDSIRASRSQGPLLAGRQKIALSTRLCAAVIAAVSTLKAVPALQGAIKPNEDGVRLGRRFAKTAGARAALLALFWLRKRPEVLVLAADLSFARMPVAFAASAAEIPTFLVFLDQPYWGRAHQMTVFSPGVLRGCFVHDLEDAVNASVDAEVPRAKIDLGLRRRVVDPSRLSVGILLDRGSDPSAAVDVGRVVHKARNVGRVYLRPHPGDDSRDWEAAIQTAPHLKLDTNWNIYDFASNVDLCLTTFTNARRTLQRLGVPCWQIAERIPYSAGRAPQGLDVSQKDPLGLDEARGPLIEFLEEIGAEDLDPPTCKKQNATHDEGSPHRVVSVEALLASIDTRSH